MVSTVIREEYQKGLVFEPIIIILFSRKTQLNKHCGGIVPMFIKARAMT